jgi:hypothetical protein
MFVIKAASINPGAQVVVVIRIPPAKFINAQSATGTADLGLKVKFPVSSKLNFYFPAVLPDVES